jgi:hypothetical protein
VPKIRAVAEIEEPASVTLSREIAAEFEKNVASCEPVSLAMRIQSMADSSQAIPGLFSTQSENRDHTRRLHPQVRIQIVPACESQIWCSFATGVSGKTGDRQTFLIRFFGQRQDSGPDWP